MAGVHLLLVHAVVLCGVVSSSASVPPSSVSFTQVADAARPSGSVFEQATNTVDLRTRTALAR